MGPPVSPTVGRGAGLLALALIAYSLAGAIWGAVRPVHTGELLEGGAVALDPAVNVEFTSFLWFVVLTGVLGAVVGAVAFVSLPQQRGIVTMLLVMGLVAVASVSFLLVGDSVSAVVHDIPSHPDAVEVGDHVSVVPRLSPGTGWIVAPFMAGVAYWLCGALTSMERSE